MHGVTCQLVEPLRGLQQHCKLLVDNRKEGQSVALVGARVANMGPAIAVGQQARVPLRASEGPEQLKSLISACETFASARTAGQAC